MRFSSRALAAVLLSASLASNDDGPYAHGFSFHSPLSPPFKSAAGGTKYSSRNGCGLPASVVAAPVEEVIGEDDDPYASINRMTYRELQRECKARNLAATGNTATLRGRLLEDSGAVLCRNDETDAEDCVVVPTGIDFTDDSDPDFEYNSLLKEVLDKASIGHWKAATRKLKQLKRRHCSSPDSTYTVPQEAYLSVLEACAADRLHGARAAEPARKIVEEMVEAGFDVPSGLINGCVISCLGMGHGGTHDNFGGIDPALAMLAAVESIAASSNNNRPIVAEDTYGAVVGALSRDGSVEEALLLLRAMVVEHGFTPPLSTFADVAAAAARDGDSAEAVLQAMTLVKAAGYELDSVGSAEAGRSVLASGVIAAEQLNNLALGLRFLTAAGKAKGCAPDRGDDLVAASSKAAQRASTLIHRRAIDKAVKESNWKLAVKLLSLMPQRSLRPSAGVLRKVVTVCAKNEKSRKSTSLLLDWVKLYEEGKAEKPPLSVFNTVVNTCEICGEEELTLAVLEAMKKTHDTEGNIVTFNIALKRLAKRGETRACEGIIIGMLKAGIEPNVVSYTTAVGACAKPDRRDPGLAFEWIKRMRARGVHPNFHTYNTALSACLDGKLESTVLGSKIATLMYDDVGRELAVGLKGSAEYNSVIPDTYTKLLARQLMKQLRENWRSEDINMQVAKATVRVPLLKLVDFNRTEVAKVVRSQLEDAKARLAAERAVAEEEKKKKKAATDVEEEDDDEEVVAKDETEIEFATVNQLHVEGRRNVEV